MKMQAFLPATSLKRLQQRCFLDYTAKFLRAAILINICERLLLETFSFFLHEQIRKLPF